ncbi:hypothetical protein MPSEU_000622700 [Mayamaea pseudoterrestris]|nr:hypothetical protein MPSEU_000622700 [Mayamaea pseudoterrestris]
MVKVPLLLVLGLALLLVLLDCCSRLNGNDSESTLALALEDAEEADESIITPSRSLMRSRKQRKLVTTSAVPFNFALYTFDEIGEKANAWATEFPNFLRVTTAQDEFNLPAAGGKLNHILYVQDYVAHPPGSASSNRLPEVLWSGEVHGDERVGPASVMEAAHLLLLAASCEAQLTSTCQDYLLQVYNVDQTQRQWLARLVSTRRIVIVPTANALGYAQNKREENRIDPNRDFPYDLLPQSGAAPCMQSVAARTLNEIFRKHMFQLTLTLHGGMEVISYEWGAPSYDGLSPDHYAQDEISAAYSHMGGSFSGSRTYAYGISNKVVYPVRGGMEDWAYAGSWDEHRNTACAGYPASKVAYNAGTLRAFNILVEVSNDKSPQASTLGNSAQILSPTSIGNGYVSRVLRIALMSAELVEPYVKIASVNGQALGQDIVPSQKRNKLQCQRSRQLTIASPSTVSLSWQVGGGMTVDATQIWFAKWKNPSKEPLDCVSQPSAAYVSGRFKQGTVTSVKQGLGLFSNDSGAGTLFQGSVDLSEFTSGDSIVVLVSAQVDQGWKNVPANASPNGPPQSHVVNARTNSNWSYRSSGKVIKGRLDWFSIPYTINIQ